MKSIETKYIGPSNSKGARITARAEGGASISIPYPYEFEGEKAHAVAAAALMKKMGWKGNLRGGGNVRGDGYNFVFCK